jgi:hypothetical protein
MIHIGFGISFLGIFVSALAIEFIRRVGSENGMRQQQRQKTATPQPDYKSESLHDEAPPQTDYLVKGTFDRLTRSDAGCWMLDAGYIRAPFPYF